jgi:hypothetical protein
MLSFDFDAIFKRFGDHPHRSRKRVCTAIAAQDDVEAGPCYNPAPWLRRHRVVAIRGPGRFFLSGAVFLTVPDKGRATASATGLAPKGWQAS